jgi:hydrogenase maturation protein HypF
VSKDADSHVAPAVLGPSRRAGVMLPSTPLHHRLAALCDRPLVMTSGNVSGAPVEIDHAGALRALAPLVDALLLHDRPIARRVEDSVVALAHDGPRVVRRARGLAPEPLRLPAAAPAPVLAVGGHLKNTVCVVVDDLAYLSPHLGDLDTVEAEAAWLAEVASLERLLGVAPDVVAHDLHPGYATTRLAAARARRRLLGVQHHHAHVLAAVAELHLDEPVIGVAFDGTGWGPDGTSWGGEVLLVDGARWWRLATVRPLPLPGGEAAIRAVWRQALAALHDALGPDEAAAVAPRLPALAAVAPEARAVVARLLSTGVEVVPARGVGRWFDAVGALALGVAEAGFDGHVAVALEEACTSADVDAARPYPLDAPRGLAPVAPAEVPAALDLRPTVRAVVDDVLAGAAPAAIAARFHRALLDGTVDVVEQALLATGARWIVPTGGALHNAHLARGLARRLGDRVRAPRAVPVNDGGLALGQAWAAVLALRGEAG